MLFPSPRRTLPRRSLLLLALSLAVVTSVWAQPAPAPPDTASPKSPAFEVATIKPGKDLGGFAVLWLPGGKFTTRDTTVKDLVRLAYNIEFFSTDRVDGGPAWANSAHFDIEARAENPIPAEWSAVPEGQRNRSMLQALLADRFKLKLHRETRELPVYVLTVAKNGPRMKPTTHALTAAELSSPRPFGAIRSMSENWGGTRSLGAGHEVAQRETMDMFVGFLQYQPEIAGRGVIDKTGLMGAYDFALEWLPQGAPPSSPGGTGLASADPSWPSLFTALQEQLGLRLDATKGPVDVIVH